MLTEQDVRKAIESILHTKEVWTWDLDFDFRKETMDSLDQATLALHLAENHGFKISDSELDKLRTIRAVLEHAASTS